MSVPVFRKTKSNGKEFIRSIQRENELIYYNYWNKSPKFDEYLYNLRTNAEFDKAVKQNKKRFAMPVKEAIKRFSVFECIVIALIGAAVCSGGALYISGKHGGTTKIDKELFKDISLLIASVLASMVIVGLVNVDLIRLEQRREIRAFYNHLVIRCFDIMKINHKNLNQDILQNYNPALAQVVSALMMSNMQTEETKQIQKLAETVATNIAESSEEQLILFDKQLKSAMEIVKNALQRNPSLYNEILRVYQGKIPTTFVINNNQHAR